MTEIVIWSRMPFPEAFPDSMQGHLLSPAASMVPQPQPQNCSPSLLLQMPQKRLQPGAPQQASHAASGHRRAG